MNTYTYQEFKENLDTIWMDVINKKQPAIISNVNTKDCALLPASDVSSMQESIYLLSSRNNADRLLRAIERTDTSSLPVFTIEQLTNSLGLSDSELDSDLDNWD